MCCCVFWTVWSKRSKCTVLLFTLIAFISVFFLFRVYNVLYLSHAPNVDVVWYTFSFKYNYSSTSETVKTKLYHIFFSLLFASTYICVTVSEWEKHCRSNYNEMYKERCKTKQKKPIQHSIECMWVCANAFCSVVNLIVAKKALCRVKEERGKEERKRNEGMLQFNQLIHWIPAIFICFHIFTQIDFSHF